MQMRKALTKARSGTLVAQVLLLITIASRSSAAAVQQNCFREEGSIDTMGTVIAIEAYGPDPARVKAAIADALKEARRLDAMLSNYRPETEWSRMNRLAAGQPVHVSKELFALLTACAEYNRESEGTFDISIGPLMRIWGFYKGSGRLPAPSEVLAAMRSVGYQNVVLDRAQQTVRFVKQGIELDPGGIGKGYAVDRMAQIYAKRASRRRLFRRAAAASMHSARPQAKRAGASICKTRERHQNPLPASSCVTNPSPLPVTTKNFSMRMGNDGVTLWILAQVIPRTACYLCL